MDLEDLKSARRSVTGMKQTIKALEGGKACHVFVARDADERISCHVLETCERCRVPVTMVDTMAELGKASNIKVKAATAAILSE